MVAVFVRRGSRWSFARALVVALVALAALAAPASAQVTAFRQAVAEGVASDPDLAAFYRETVYAPIWTGPGAADRARRAALVQALSEVSYHGLPEARYDLDGVLAAMAAVRSTRDLGLVEARLSKTYLRYARDVQSGILVPSSVDDGIKRKVEYRPRRSYLTGLIEADNPAAYMRSLPPATGEYRALMKEKLRLEHLIASGGWGPGVPGGKLKPGQSGEAVVALRNRLIAMGYLKRSATASYDSEIEKAVQRFQLEHGLEPDGVAGDGTIAELNVGPEARLKSVIVAMERERWLNHDRGDPHILVNQTDFTAKIVVHGAVTFETRSVIGKNQPDLRSPEFSDQMEHMIINPSWHVPRSIITAEYLPALRENPNAAGHLIITDARGRQVDRSAVDFTQYSSRNFPFDMRQPPGSRNALGLVKFMFPNPYNIYLHDTPQKSLFQRETRAFSHGCIRLADPFDFAYALLAMQEDDPVGFFQNVLKTGRETKVDLKRPIPVHLIYRTAFTTPRGVTEYRRDVYGRDARIWDALSAEGVALPALRG